MPLIAKLPRGHSVSLHGLSDMLAFYIRSTWRRIQNVIPHKGLVDDMISYIGCDARGESEMTNKAFCEKYDLTEKQFNGEDKFDGYLDLGSVTSIPEGFNPTVGGYLDLGSVTSIPEGFNPTVGGSLYLGSVKGPKPTPKTPVYPIIYPNGKYILADGILQHLVGKKGNVYRVRYLTKPELSYLVTDGNGRFAHGDTIKAARESLIYKIGDRDTSQYNGMTIETKLTYAKAIEAYRVITGACEAGVRAFIARKVGTPKKSYTIKDIIAVTDGEYGHDAFVGFFS